MNSLALLLASGLGTAKTPAVCPVFTPRRPNTVWICSAWIVALDMLLQEANDYNIQSIYMITTYMLNVSLNN